MKNEDEMHDLEKKKIELNTQNPSTKEARVRFLVFIFFVSNFFFSVLSMIIIIMDSYQSPLRPCCICLVLFFENPSSLSFSLSGGLLWFVCFLSC